MAPPYVDEDINESSVAQGLAAAEDELRDTVADAYEDGARSSSELDEAMDDIDHTEAEGSAMPAELAAIRREPQPDDEE